MGDFAYNYLSNGTQGGPAIHFPDWLGLPLDHDNTWAMGDPPVDSADGQSTPDFSIPSPSYVVEPSAYLDPSDRTRTEDFRIISRYSLPLHPPKHRPRRTHDLRCPRWNQAATKPARSRTPGESGSAVAAVKVFVGTTSASVILSMQGGVRCASHVTKRSTGGKTRREGTTTNIARGWTSGGTLRISGSKTHLSLCEGGVTSCWS